MPITIDMPGLAKVASGDLIKDLKRERAQARYRQGKAEKKLAAFKTMKADLAPYLSPADYDCVLEKLKGEVSRWKAQYQEVDSRLENEKRKNSVDFGRILKAAGAI
jgi:hypothetical protein